MGLDTIHGNAVTQVRVGEDLLTVGDGERRTPTPARRGVEGLQGRDS